MMVGKRRKEKKRKEKKRKERNNHAAAPRRSCSISMTLLVSVLAVNRNSIVVRVHFGFASIDLQQLIKNV
jgi:hypothetical protein